MENLVARVAAAADTTPDIARQAVAMVVDFIKKEAPAEAVDKLLTKAPALNAIVASGATSSGEGLGGMLSGLMGAVSGMGGSGGLMGLGSQMMGLGLGMGQIQAVGKEVFAYAREVGGDDVVGEISAAIPGVSQFI